MPLVRTLPTRRRARLQTIIAGGGSCVVENFGSSIQRCDIGYVVSTDAAASRVIICCENVLLMAVYLSFALLTFTGGRARMGRKYH